MSPLRTAALAILTGALFFCGLARAEDLSDRVRRAVETLYFHGLDARTAHADIGRDGIPVLLELLADPDCPRRDNVVAFLTHLGGEESVGPLLQFLEAPPAGIVRPEEDRGLLLAPPALAHIAARGSARAFSCPPRWASDWVNSMRHCRS